MLWIIATAGESPPGASASESPLPLVEVAQRKAFVSIGDYTIGGAAAGLAGALGKQNNILRSRSVTRAGLATGVGLGLLAGILQAGIDVGNLYLEREQSEERERQRVREDEELLSTNEDQTS